MKKGLRQNRLCNCGCGKSVSQNYDSFGRFKGYHKRAKGCEKKVLKQTREKISESTKGLKNCRSKPLMTKRQHMQTCKPYMQIKINESGRWIYEHRWIMQNHLSRPLSNKEHVHHINGDTLDNRIENLIVLSHSDHSKITCQTSFKGFDPKKLHKCPLCKKEYCCD